MSAESDVLARLGPDVVGYVASQNRRWEIPELRLRADGRMVILGGNNGEGKTTVLRWLYQQMPSVYVSDAVEFPDRYVPARVVRHYAGRGLPADYPPEMLPEELPWRVLSRGNRQKVRVLVSIAIACGRTTDDASLLLLDEPTSGLDARAQAAFWSYLSKIAVGRRSSMKIVVVSHEWRGVTSDLKGAVEPELWRIEGGKLACT